MPEYSIFAVKYAGTFNRATPLMIWFKDRDQTTPINYYIFVVRNDQETVIVDAGVRPAEAAARGLEGYVSPATVLARLDIDAAAVRHVILTHLHWDHASGISLFPNATFYVQREEFRFWTKDPIGQRPIYRHFADPIMEAELLALEGTNPVPPGSERGRLVLFDGDAKVLPGIEVWLAPGHTPAHQVVAVDTAMGEVVLGSDAAHIFRNWREDWPSAIITDMPAWLRSYEMMRARMKRPDLFFPGHDAQLTTGYPLVAEDITRLA